MLGTSAPVACLLCPTACSVQDLLDSGLGPIALLQKLLVREGRGGGRGIGGGVVNMENAALAVEALAVDQPCVGQSGITLSPTNTMAFLSQRC